MASLPSVPLPPISPAERDHLALAFTWVWQCGRGFQWTEPHHLIVGFLHTGSFAAPVLNPPLHERFQCSTEEIVLDDWMGRFLVKVDVRRFDRIPEIIQFILDQGIGVQPLLKMPLSYKPGQVFDGPRMEHCIVKNFQEEARNLNKLRENAYLDILCKFNPHQLEVAWMTEEGKQLCRQLKQYLRYDQNREESEYEAGCAAVLSSPAMVATLKKYQVLNYSTWWNCNYAGSEAARSETQNENEAKQAQRPDAIDLTSSSTSEDLEEEESEVEVVKVVYPMPESPRRIIKVSLSHTAVVPMPQCMICEDRIANTRVTPCNHCVVCKVCSDQLQHTNDKDSCVRCRTKIDSILFDE